jgi:Uri superfamily endonuclease
MNAIPQTKLKAGVLVFSGEATGDLIGAVRRHREERKKKAGSTRGRR